MYPPPVIAEVGCDMADIGRPNIATFDDDDVGIGVGDRGDIPIWSEKSNLFNEFQNVLEKRRFHCVLLTFNTVE